MTNRRPEATLPIGDDVAADVEFTDKLTAAAPAITIPGDVNGRLALVLAGFAVSIATFLIILVAISARNA